MDRPDVILVPYSKIRDWAFSLGKVCRSVVWDEVHALRRSESQRWVAAIDLARAVDYRLGLSGTPIFNYGGELWNVFEAIEPGFLGTREAFREQWCDRYQVGSEPMLKDPEAFGAFLRTSNRMLRRTAADVGLSPLSNRRMVVRIEADDSAAAKYRDRAAELAKTLLSSEKLGRGQAMAASGQFDSLLRQVTGLAKAPFVAEFVETLLQQGIPVVLYGWHHAVYAVWLNRLRDYNPVMYTGSQSAAEKSASLRKFVETGETNLFICSVRSGEGIDGLQRRCNTVVFGELDWAWAPMEQAEGRVCRNGQTQPCQSYYPICDFGVDPVMQEVLGIKQSQLAGVIQGDAVGRISQVSAVDHLRSLAVKFLETAQF